MDCQLYFLAVSIIGLNVLMFIILAFINIVLLILFLVFVAIITFISISQASVLANMQKDAMEHQDVFLGDIKNAIEYKREIEILKVEQVFAKRFKYSVHGWIQFMIRYRFYERLISKSPTITTSIYTIIYLFISSYFIMKGSFTIGILLFGYQCISFISNPITILCQIFIRNRANKYHYQRIDELDDKQEDVEYNALQKESTSLLKMKASNIYCDTTSTNLLYTCNELNIPLYSFTIIKGENGTGTSMLLNLMGGAVDSQFANGGISLYKDLSKLTYLTYPAIFVNGSFDENLFEIAPKKEVFDLLNIDFQHKDISTNPINLSLGQQQKLSLLRVLSLDSNILFLDEPFTNLDVQTQENLQNYLKKIKKKKTIILILHEDTLDSSADMILRIKEKQMHIEKRM